MDCLGFIIVWRGLFFFFLGLGVLERVSESGFGFHSRLLSFRVGVVGRGGLGLSFGSERGADLRLYLDLHVVPFFG